MVKPARPDEPISACGSGGGLESEAKRHKQDHNGRVELDGDDAAISAWSQGGAYDQGLAVEAISACRKGERREPEPKRQCVEGAAISACDRDGRHSDSEEGNFDTDIRNPLLPEGVSMDVSVHEQLLFDQFLRDEHNYGLWEFLKMHGVEATNASHAIFFHSCGHLLGGRAEVEPSVPEAPTPRRMRGKQVAPVGFAGTFEQPIDAVGAQVESREAEPILPEDADGHTLMVYPAWGLIWCSLCGRYQTHKRTHRLREHCPKEPRRGSHYRLKRLREGRCPTTGLPLGETAQRLTLARQSGVLAD